MPAEHTYPISSRPPRGLTGYPPHGSSIRYEKTTTGHLWNLQPTRKPAWRTREWIVLPVIAAIMAGQFFAHGSHPGWMPALFLVPVSIIVFAQLRNLHRKRNTLYRIAIDDARVAFSSQWRGQTEAQSLARAELKTIEQTPSYRRNGKTVVHIELEGNGRTLRFGDWLPSEEKAWLVAEFNEAAWPRAKAPVSAPPASEHRQSFSLLCPRDNRHPGSVMAALIGALFVGLALFAIKHDRTFQAVFGGLGALACACGLNGFVSHFRNRDVEQRLEGTGSHLILRKNRKGQLLNEQIFPWESVLDLRASQAAQTDQANQTSFLNLELLTIDRSIVLAQWLKPAEAIAFVEQANQAMGR